MKIIFGISVVSICLSLTGCLKAVNGPTSGAANRSSPSVALSSTAAMVDGQSDKATALIDATSQKTQVVNAPGEGALAGSSIQVKQGSLALSVSLVIEAGVALTDTSVVSESPFPADVQIQNAGAGIVIRPSASVELRHPLQISLPLPAALGLAEKTYAVFYKYLDPSTNKLLTGLIPMDGTASFTRFDDNSQRDVVQFDGYFGSYWVVQISRPLTVSEIPQPKETSEPIINKNKTSVISIDGIVSEASIVATQKIALLTLAQAELSFDTKAREVTLRVAGDSRIKSCKADVYENATDLNGLSVDAGATFSVALKITKTSAHSLTGRFRCIDENAKSVVSSWSTAVNIPGLAPSPAATPAPSSSSPPNGTVAAAPLPTTATPFITVWKTDNTGSNSDNRTILLPLVPGGTYNFTVDWGDTILQNVSAWNDINSRHTYAQAGTYTVKIYGTIIGWSFGAQTADPEKFLRIMQWGDFRLGSSTQAFAYASNLIIQATDSPNLAGAFDLSGMFALCSSITAIPNINTWNVSQVVSFQEMFFQASHFNSDIGAWNTSSAQSMTSMFAGAFEFNQNIGGWDVSQVQSMGEMFDNAVAFNQDLGAWEPEMVGDMQDMLSGTALSSANYSSTLEGWASGTLLNNVMLGATGLHYQSSALSSRNHLTTSLLWTITDAGTGP